MDPLAYLDSLELKSHYMQLMSLLLFMAEQGSCETSYAELEQRTGKKAASLKNALKQLLAAGLLDYKPPRRGKDRFTVTLTYATPETDSPLRLEPRVPPEEALEAEPAPDQDDLNSAETPGDAVLPSPPPAARAAEPDRRVVREPTSMVADRPAKSASLVLRRHAIVERGARFPALLPMVLLGLVGVLQALHALRLPLPVGLLGVMGLLLLLGRWLPIPGRVHSGTGRLGQVHLKRSLVQWLGWLCLLAYSSLVLLVEKGVLGLG